MASLGSQRQKASNARNQEEERPQVCPKVQSLQGLDGAQPLIQEENQQGR